MKKVGKRTVRNPQKPWATAKSAPLRSILDRALIRSGTLVALISLLLLFSPWAAGASLEITVTPGSWAPTVGATQLNLGYVEALAQEEMWCSSTDNTFTVTVSRTDTNWVAAWVLQAKDDVHTTYHTITTSPTTYATGPLTEGVTWTMDWKLSGLTYANTPSGTYSTTVLFTIQQP